MGDTSQLRSNRSREAAEYLDVVAVRGAIGTKCSGVVVAPRWVLTARHCVPVKEVRAIDRRGRTIDRRVAEAALHPRREVDAALLLLEGSIDVPTRPFRAAAAGLPGTFARVVGFGAADWRTRAGVGTKTRFDVPLGNPGCDRHRAARLGCSRQFELVVPASTGLDTCVGDSGGALIDEGGRLAAITSRGIPIPGRTCGHGGIYTRVDALSPWIRLTTGEGRRR